MCSRKLSSEGASIPNSDNDDIDRGSSLAPSPIRDDFPFLRDHTYLNSASCSPCPEPVLAAMLDFYRYNPINYRSGNTPSEQRVTSQVDSVREQLSAFIGAHSPREIVFTKNTTEAINTVARGLEWERGDEVILSPIEHQSNLIPWMRVAQAAGVVLKYVVPNPDGLITPESVGNLISRRTRLVSLHHVSNVLGVEQDLRAIADVAHGHGLLVLADAAQSEGRTEVDVQALGCDFLASCARKGLMGPQGVGFLWGKEELLSKLPPLSLGSQAAVATGPSSFELEDIPARHEAGILNTAGVIGLGASLKYVQAIGLPTIATYVENLSQHLMSVLTHTGDIEVYGSRNSPRLGIISWNIKGKDSYTVARELFERRGVMASGGSCGSPLALRLFGVSGVVRTSLHYFNSHDDIERLGEALEQLA